MKIEEIVNSYVRKTCSPRSEILAPPWRANRLYMEVASPLREKCFPLP